MQGDGLSAVRKRAHDTGGEEVEGAAEEDVVGRGANDVELQVDSDGTETNGDVPREAKRVVAGPIGTLHLEDDSGVVDEAKVVADALGHRDDGGAGVMDAGDLGAVAEHTWNCADGCGLESDSELLRLFAWWQGLEVHLDGVRDHQRAGRWARRGSLCLFERCWH